MRLTPAPQDMSEQLAVVVDAYAAIVRQIAEIHAGVSELVEDELADLIETDDAADDVDADAPLGA